MCPLEACFLTDIDQVGSKETQHPLCPGAMGLATSSPLPHPPLPSPPPLYPSLELAARVHRQLGRVAKSAQLPGKLGGQAEGRKHRLSLKGGCQRISGSWTSKGAPPGFPSCLGRSFHGAVLPVLARWLSSSSSIEELK